MYVCMYLYTHTRTYLYAHVIRSNLRSIHTVTYTHTYTPYIHMYIHTCICIPVYACHPLAQLASKLHYWAQAYTQSQAVEEFLQALFLEPARMYVRVCVCMYVRIAKELLLSWICMYVFTYICMCASCKGYRLEAQVVGIHVESAGSDSEAAFIHTYIHTYIRTHKHTHKHIPSRGAGYWDTRWKHWI